MIDMFTVHTKDEFGKITQVIDCEDFIYPVANNIVVELNQHSGIRTLHLIKVNWGDVLEVVKTVLLEAP